MIVPTCTHLGRTRAGFCPVVEGLKVLNGLQNWAHYDPIAHNWRLKKRSQLIPGLQSIDFNFVSSELYWESQPCHVRNLPVLNLRTIPLATHG
jgi:hypothetical protein